MMGDETTSLQKALTESEHPQSPIQSPVEAEESDLALRGEQVENFKKQLEGLGMKVNEPEARTADGEG